MRKVLITGSCGLVGSETAKFFSELGWHVSGIDNDNRGKWFSNKGSVRSVRDELDRLPSYKHYGTSVTSWDAIKYVVETEKPDLIVHAAAQPSHDKSAEIPREDFMVNAAGTINLLEAVRLAVPSSPFVFLSTNKVYGTRPNLLPAKEAETRYVIDDFEGVDESMPLDQCLHSPFGASKASADLVVQEYGKYFDMPTVSLRCGCITGAAHRGVELHGFLSHLCKTAKAEQPYTIYGYKGKQVRDILHAADVASAIYEIYKAPVKGEVFNLGGGLLQSVSVLESIELIERLLGTEMSVELAPARKGDHICYYSDTRKFRAYFPDWRIQHGILSIFDELLSAEQLHEQVGV